MLYSKSTGGFYSEEIHGAKRIRIIDPSYDPQISVFVDGEEAPTVPMVEIDNPDCKIPHDAVEITVEQHTALMDAQSNGQIISADADGFPVAIDRPAPTATELQAAKNAEARSYLLSTDWYVTRKIETGESVPADITTARAEARASVIE